MKQKQPWRLMGYDAFANEWYPLRGTYPSEAAVLEAAKKRLADLEKSQPSAESGGQAFGGIQDRVIVERPDGTRYRYTGQEARKPKPKKRKRRNGFTLIELLIVVAIMMIIAAIAIPALMAPKDPEQAYARCSPQFKGGGVWYFTCNAQTFSMALGRFRVLHPELTVISVAPATNESGQYAATVVTEPAPRLPAEQQ